ncbi:endonuclease [Yasminevirus sp. GU-2018]|uniref:Endonuclease n=1 Tax=Yasminevirus sp. GU-2018 TaxID=2420051 RepID=A0A5K0U879_9VIRU|nr:endonuclease [Yasminevirus sp. GU-2018]
MSLIGVHVGDVTDIVEIMDKNPVYKKLDLVQTFVSATTNYSDKKFTPVKKLIAEKDIKLVVHISYSINLSRRWTENDWWIQQFIGEIEGASALNAFAVVVHTGKKLELSDAEALNNMYTSLLYVHGKTFASNKIKILIETPSGQGSETLTKIEELCRFMGKFYKHPDDFVKERFGLCLDTCHVFASGYDIRTKTDLNNVFGIIDRSIGTNKIKLCHINDSKKGLGSKLDRHENVGEGEIGEKSIINIVKFMKKLGVPMILETPAEHIDHDYELLRSV